MAVRLTHTHTIRDLCIATRWQHVANTKCCCTDWNAAVAGRHGFRWCLCCCCWCLISTRWSIGHMEKYFFKEIAKCWLAEKSGARLKRSASAIWNWLGLRKKMQEERGEAAAQLSQTEIVLWQWLEDKRKAIASLRIRPTTHNFPTLVWAHRSWRMICGALSRKKSERQAGKGRAINATAEIWCWNSNWSSFILSHLRAEQFEPLLLLLPDAYRAH